MTFYVENETDEEFPFDAEELIKTLTQTVSARFDIPYELCLNVTFTDDKTIRGINKEFRNIDRSTDVLSFPRLNLKSPVIFQIFRKMIRSASIRIQASLYSVIS